MRFDGDVTDISRPQGLDAGGAGRAPARPEHGLPELFQGAVFKNDPGRGLAQQCGLVCFPEDLPPTGGKAPAGDEWLLGTGGSAGTDDFGVNSEGWL